MNWVGVLHILATVIAYALYVLVLLKYLSKSYNYRLLHLANALYVGGFALGMVWANSEWGYALSPDPKIVVSILVPIPFLLEGFLKRRDWRIPASGCLLIVLNYVLPFLLGTLHSH